MRALIVEDDKIIRNHIALMLSDTNLFTQISEVSTGAEALDICKLTFFDIVYLDIKLPDMCGIDIAKNLRESNSNIAIVFASGHRHYGPEAFQVEAVDYLIKPLTRPTIASSLNKALRFLNDKRPQNKLLIKNNISIIAIDPEKIIFVEKKGKKTVIHCINDKIELSNYPLKLIGEQAKSYLVRSHNGFLVNPLYIEEMRTYSAKSYEITFENTDAKALILKSRLKELRTIFPNYRTKDLE